MQACKDVPKHNQQKRKKPFVLQDGIWRKTAIIAIQTVRNKIKSHEKYVICFYYRSKFYIHLGSCHQCLLALFLLLFTTMTLHLIARIEPELQCTIFHVVPATQPRETNHLGVPMIQCCSSVLRFETNTVIVKPSHSKNWKHLLAPSSSICWLPPVSLDYNKKRIIIRNIFVWDTDYNVLKWAIWVWTLAGVNVPTCHLFICYFWHKWKLSYIHVHNMYQVTQWHYTYHIIAAWLTGLQSLLTQLCYWLQSKFSSLG